MTRSVRIYEFGDADVLRELTRDDGKLAADAHRFPRARSSSRD